MINDSVVKKINLACLLIAIITVLFIPVKKEIWYDETVSILCSKGISHDTHTFFAGNATVSSSAINQLNTPGNVFTATVLDNSNSYLYNISLHWFTAVLGNHLGTYVLFSELCGIAALLAFYFLCTLLFGNSLFIAIAMLLLVTDNDYMGMAHEIRAYALGIFFVTLAAAYFYKFMYRQERPLYLFLTGLFSVGAVLSHFLSVYIIMVFLAGLVLHKRERLLKPKNLLAILAPVLLIALFFYSSIEGLRVMNVQNKQIQERSGSFNAIEVMFRAMKFTAVNFKATFPAYWNSAVVTLGSFLFVIGISAYGVSVAKAGEQRRNLVLLFILGISGPLFLAMLCFKSHHYTAIYYRYFSFCIPFTCLFIAYLFYVLFSGPALHDVVKGALFAAIVIPSVALFVLVSRRSHPPVKYNHPGIAREIQRSNVQKLEVPEWSDALLVNSFLPAGYKIDYVLNPASPNFALYKKDTVEQIPVVKNNL